MYILPFFGKPSAPLSPQPRTDERSAAEVEDESEKARGLDEEDRSTTEAMNDHDKLALEAASSQREQAQNVAAAEQEQLAEHAAEARIRVEPASSAKEMRTPRNKGTRPVTGGQSTANLPDEGRCRDGRHQRIEPR